MSLKIVIGGQAFSFELALFRAQTLDFGGQSPKMYRGASRVCLWLLCKRGWIARRRVCVYTPGRLTWNPKMEVWKMIFLFYWVIFRFQPFIFQGIKSQLSSQPTNVWSHRNGVSTVRVESVQPRVRSSTKIIGKRISWANKQPSYTPEI